MVSKTKKSLSIKVDFISVCSFKVHEITSHAIILSSFRWCQLPL